MNRSLAAAVCSKSFWLAAAAALSLAIPLSSVRAAFTVTGQVDPAHPSAWTNSTMGYVGKTIGGNLMVDGDSDLLSDFGYLGYNSGVLGEVTISGSGSTWTSQNALLIGFMGSGMLNIIGGGTLSNNWTASIGYYSGSSGTAIVDGAGSTWSNRGYLYVGNSGSGMLKIINGGTVTNTWGYSGYIGNISGSSGTVIVDGTGSTLSSSGELFVGNSGNGTLNITGGGTVSSTSYSHSYLGYNSGSSGTATVDGTGSKWTNGTIFVGNSGIGILNVISGGTLRNTGYAYLGYNSGSSGTMTVDGTGSNWNCSSGLHIGASGSGTLNVLTNGGTVNCMNHIYLGYNSGSSGTVTVDGAGSIWNYSSGLYIGSSGIGTLNITNGGTVGNVSGYTDYIGYNSGSSGIVTVDGAGSTLSSNTLFVGNYGNGTLNISNGSSVSVNYTTFIAANTGSTGTINFGPNDGTLTTRSLWGAATQLTGAGTINTNGLVSGFDLIFNGSATSSTSFGTGGTLNIDLSAISGNGDLGIGFGSSNTLTVKNGASIYSARGYLGYDSGSSGTATVDGAGSKWSINSDNYDSGYLYVGYAGSGTLNITNGGTVSVSGTTCVQDPMSSINFGSSGGTLTTNGLEVSSTRLTGTGTINTKGLISGLNLLFDGIGTCSTTFGTAGTLTIDLSATSGNGKLGMGYGNNSTLTVRNGANIYSDTGYLGYDSGWSGTAIVDGAGSKWNLSGVDYYSGYLYVGSVGNGTLDITNGGSVSAFNGYIGFNSGSSGTVTVDGAGSNWSMIFGSYENGNLFVGSFGSGTLSIKNGGTISINAGFIGDNSGSLGTATVDGAGSNWTNTSFLLVGNYGSATLNIKNGGTVSNITGYIGGNSGSSGTVTVDGVGSTWTNTGSLYVGDSGTGTVIQNGGTISVTSTIYLGYNFSGNGTYNLNGGTLILTSLEKGSGTAAFNFGGGTLQAGSAFTSSLPMTLTGSGGNANFDTQNYAVTLSGDLSGTGGLNKLGDGTLTVTGNLTYSGTTTIGNGLLQINTPTTVALPTLDAIAGEGMLTIGNGSVATNLTATSVSIGTLRISAGSKLTIASMSGARAFAVPEPSTFLLLGFGAFSLLAYVWRQRNLGE